MPEPLFKTDPARRSLPSDAPAPSPQDSASARPSDTVLLVDDHDLVRATTAEVLVDLGYRVIEARSGEDAIRLLADGLEIDLMITDLLMPGLDGTELAALARARRPGLPVLLVSGQSDPDGVPAELPCLTKPYRRTALADCLAALRPLARVE